MNRARVRTRARAQVYDRSVPQTTISLNICNDALAPPPVCKQIPAAAALQYNAQTCRSFGTVTKVTDNADGSAGLTLDYSRSREAADAPLLQIVFRCNRTAEARLPLLPPGGCGTSPATTCILKWATAYACPPPPHSGGKGPLIGGIVGAFFAVGCVVGYVMRRVRRARLDLDPFRVDFDSDEYRQRTVSAVSTESSNEYHQI